MQTSVTLPLARINTTAKWVSNQMAQFTICTDLHLLLNLPQETEKLARNVTLINSNHKGREPKINLKHLVQSQSHYVTDLYGEIKGGWVFAQKASHKCDLAYL